MFEEPTVLIGTEQVRTFEELLPAELRENPVALDWWRYWIERRRKVHGKAKGSVDERIARSRIRSLCRLNGNKLDILEKAATGGWLDFYEPKKEKGAIERVALVKQSKPIVEQPRIPRSDETRKFIREDLREIGYKPKEKVEKSKVAPVEFVVPEGEKEMLLRAQRDAEYALGIRR